MVAHPQRHSYPSLRSIEAIGLGADHPYYAVALNRLGIVVQAQSKYTEAEGLYERASRPDGAA
jgi:Tetratricopeptide repeat